MLSLALHHTFFLIGAQNVQSVPHSVPPPFNNNFPGALLFEFWCWGKAEEIKCKDERRKGFPLKTKLVKYQLIHCVKFLIILCNVF
jgi:hypothetical protein